MVRLRAMQSIRPKAEETVAIRESLATPAAPLGPKKLAATITCRTSTSRANKPTKPPLVNHALCLRNSAPLFQPTIAQRQSNAFILPNAFRRARRSRDVHDPQGAMSHNGRRKGIVRDSIPSDGIRQSGSTRVRANKVMESIGGPVDGRAAGRQEHSKSWVLLQHTAVSHGGWVRVSGRT